MSKRSVFTTITPLPVGVTRETVMEFLKCHEELISLNPLVVEYHRIKPPAQATPEEYHCIWYELTDKIQYLPGGRASGKVTYTACFHDLGNDRVSNGLQTHVYAPMGLDIKEKWTVNGSMPGEPTQPQEIGMGIPLSGLYLREDVDMTCNILMTSFVKKNLKKSHGALVARLVVKAQLHEAASINDRMSDRSTIVGSSSLGGSPRSSPCLSSATLAHQSSARSSMASSVYQPQGGLSLIPVPSYQNQDPRNSYLPNQSQMPYQQALDPRMDPRMSMHSQRDPRVSIQPYIDPGYQAYLQHLQQQQQRPTATSSHSLAPPTGYYDMRSRSDSNLAEMSSETPPWDTKKVGGPPAHSSFAAELE